MGTKLYVGNLSYSTTEATLRAAFETNGRQVREVAVISDRDTGRPRGFAFVRMSSDAEAAAAISEMDGKEVDGRRLRVNEAQDRPPQQRSGGFSGGGHSGGGGGGGGGGRSRGDGDRGDRGDRDDRRGRSYDRD